MNSSTTRTASFGPYALDLRSGELRKFGVRVKMGEQPFQILVLLLENPGEMVSREELRAKLWVDDTFVDFDHGLNSAVQRLRDCLSDTAERPLWIETIPRRGYRFIGRAEWLSGSPTPFPRNGERAVGAVRTDEFRREQSGQLADTNKPASASRWVYLTLAGLILVSIFVAGIRTFLNNETVAPFAHFSATKLTNSGKVAETAISADGRFVLNVVNDKARMSLWLFNVGTGSNTQISPPEARVITDPAFSPDGDYVYFRRGNDSTEQFWDLYRIPVLGGAAQNLIHDVDGGPAFSQADPKRLIFIRLNDPEVGKYYLLSADLEGGNEKVLVAEKVLPAKTLSWSPDAKFLADVIYTKDGSTLLRTFDLAVKKWRALAEFKDRDIPAVNWAPDGRGVYVCYRLRTAPPHVAQIGYVSFPRGEFREMTNDLNGYLGINISKDGKFIATLQAQPSFSILLRASNEVKASASLPLPAHETIVGFDWASDSEMLVAGIHAVRRLNLDGSGETTLTSDPNAEVVDVVNCGRHVLVPWRFKNNTNQLNIWRMDPDGLNLMQLTHGQADVCGECSSDGKFVYYFESADAMWTMRIPIDGGTVEKIRVDQSDRGLVGLDGIGISRDGRWMATASTGDVDGQPLQRIHVLGLGENANAPARSFIGDPRFMKLLRMTPDGRFVTFVINDQGSEMLWARPVNGGVGHPLTEGSEDDLWDYRWSPDAKTLAVERIHGQVDAVLLQDTSK